MCDYDKRCRITYKIIEAAVDKGIRYIKEDGNRGVRNIVDLGAHFAKGRFQKNFFIFAQTVLNNENSAYYTFARNLVENVDDSIIKKFGINLGYNCLTYGTKEIRKNEKKYGYCMPWTIVFDFSLPAPTMFEDDVSKILISGEALGIYCAYFFAGHNALLLKNLLSSLRRRQDGAYFIFADPAIVTDDIIDLAVDAGNVLIILSMDCTRNLKETMCASIKLLNKNCLFGIYSTYDDTNVEWIMSRAFTEQALKTRCAAAYLVQKKPLDGANEHRFLRFVHKIKADNPDPFFRVDFYRDLAYIDRIISDDDCFLSIDGDGNVTSSHLDSAEHLNAKEHSLSEILKKAMPKSK